MLKDIFKAYDVRATYPSPLDEAAAWKVGCAAGRFLKSAQKPGDLERADAVVVSRDMRPHSPQLGDALIQGLRAAGMNVIDVGMCDTSIIYFAVNHLGTAGGIQTTASHNPINYNGFKISGPQARPIGAETGLNEILRIAQSLGEPGSLPATGKLEQRDVWAAYREHILKFFIAPRRKIRVFIDCANGMSGKLVPKVFSGLENVEIIPLNFEITGQFAHEPNPLKAENMIPTQEGVKRHQADLGVSFDGDADRCMLVDERGRIVGCDHLTALLASHFVAMDQANPSTHGTAIVYDLRSSKVVEETIQALDARPVRSKVGHVFMKAALREHRAIFGGELSGHFYFRDNYYADSGAITFAVMLTVMGQSGKALGEMIDPLLKYPQSGELNFHNEDKFGTLQALKQRYSGATIEELDGVSIDSFEQRGWWFNVRMSNTEPLLRLNAEARDRATLQSLLDEITPLLGEADQGH